MTFFKLLLTFSLQLFVQFPVAMHTFFGIPVMVTAQPTFKPHSFRFGSKTMPKVDVMVFQPNLCLTDVALLYCLQD
jgi:hypothetical protein